MNAAASLGTLLVQRIDAMLGTSVSQQAHLVTGARPDAVHQPAQAGRGAAVNNHVLRPSQENVNRATAGVDAHRMRLTHGYAEESLAHGVEPSVQLKLGATARLILDLLAQFPQRMPVQSAEPLLAGQPPALLLTQVLRQALTQAVQDSGVFYESHLAQLAAGARSADALHAEPQARAGATPESAMPDAPDIAPQTQALVRQQLEVLAHQAFVWQGQLWPGVEMEWEIRHGPPFTAMPAESDDARSSWGSVFTVNLPVLGLVCVRVALHGQNIAIIIHAADSAVPLQAQAPALRQRLSATGVHVSSLSIAAQVDVLDGADGASGQPESWV